MSEKICCTTTTKHWVALYSSSLADVAACPFPDIPGGGYIPDKNALVQNGVACGQVIEIKCFSGWRLSGAKTATCNPDGTYLWQGVLPRCRRLRYNHRTSSIVTTASTNPHLRIDMDTIDRYVPLSISNPKQPLCAKSQCHAYVFVSLCTDGREKKNRQFNCIHSSQKKLCRTGIIRTPCIVHVRSNFVSLCFIN